MPERERTSEGGWASAGGTAIAREGDVCGVARLLVLARSLFLLRPPPHRFTVSDSVSAGLQWLVAGAVPGDVLFFHFSGHGAQARRLNRMGLGKKMGLRKRMGGKTRVFPARRDRQVRGPGSGSGREGGRAGG